LIRIAIMRKRPFLVLLCLIVFGCGTLAVVGQQSSAENARTIVRKVMPAYPEVAKRMNLSGTVKLTATVAPNGTVKSVQPVGGSPVLVQAAQEAVYKWQFAAASGETKETVELHFSPQ
jgi:TonB family protein